jgi:hypothetical protein
MNSDAKDQKWERSHGRSITRLCASQFAERREFEVRLLERTKNCLSESRERVTKSRELLARVDTLLSAEPLPRTEQGAIQGILRKAVERVFDKWIDQRASPLPRSTSFH